MCFVRGKPGIEIDLDREKLGSPFAIGAQRLERAFPLVRRIRRQAETAQR